MPSLTDAPRAPQTAYTLEAIRQVIGGQLEGNPREPIRGVNSLEEARPGDLTFADHERYAPQARQTRASAILVPKAFPALPGKNLLRVEPTRVAFVKVLYLFQPPRSPEGVVHRSAVVAPDAGSSHGLARCAPWSRGWPAPA
jgi:UDP-3-O-[3-hydroxymyristoyl] glucosamine N-acyltransferase